MKTMIAATSDIVLTDLVHDHIDAFAAPDGEWRASARLVFIHRVWDAMVASGSCAHVPCMATAADRAPLFQRQRTPELADFKAWLVSALKYTDASGRPLVVLLRGSEADQRHCDLDALSASWTQIAGEQDAYFIVDRRADPKAYEPAPRKTTVINPVALRAYRAMEAGERERDASAGLTAARHADIPEAP